MAGSGVGQKGEEGRKMRASGENKVMKDVILVTSGDLRQSANEVCWPAQADLERRLTECFASAGHGCVCRD